MERICIFKIIIHVYSSYSAIWGMRWRCQVFPKSKYLLLQVNKLRLCLKCQHFALFVRFLSFLVWGMWQDFPVQVTENFTQFWRLVCLLLSIDLVFTLRESLKPQKNYVFYCQSCGDIIVKDWWVLQCLVFIAINAIVIGILVILCT